MTIHLYLTQKKIEPDYERAVKEYQKRLQRFAALTLHYGTDIKKAALSAQDKKGIRILITPGKKTPASTELAEKFSRFFVDGYSSLHFFLGSKEDAKDLNGFDEQLSLTGFSVSADLTAVLAAEQFYRAFCILNHITYHK